MIEIDFNKLEGNTHLILYYLYKVYPAMKEKNEIVQATGLHSNTVLGKLRTLLKEKLIQTKPKGRKNFYFVSQEIKNNLDEWATTAIGENLAKEFEGQLKLED